jgi:peptide deformylase
MSDDIIPGHIVLFGARVLRTECEPVEVFDEALHRDIDIMAATLKASQGGAALAAPQVSIAKRISVINYMKQYYELVNPVILEFGGSVLDFEGCLSMPSWTGRVERSQSVRVKYQDRHGEFHEMTAENEMARCLQHEIDHLDGILYIDRMTDEFVLNFETEEGIDVVKLIEYTKRQG